MKKLPALLVLLLLTACKGNVVTVVDERDQPIVGATVLAANNTNQFFDTQTSQEGTFDTADFTGNDIYATIDHPGYLSATFKIGTKNKIVLKDYKGLAAELEGNPFFLLWCGELDMDYDSDGLTCAEEFILGLHPYEADSDNDGIPDGNEVKIERPMALVPLGVTPLRKDVLLEIDWDDSIPESRVSDLALFMSKSALRKAPISNPDESTGVNFIIDHGEYGGGDGSGEYELANERRPYFYHMSAESGEVTDGYNGWGEFNGRYTWINADFGSYGIAEPFIETYLILHEIGHNFGLDHGGEDATPCKPNYVSVMNYNPLMSLSFTYSPGDLPTLDESALDESAGIGSGPVDWNFNYLIDKESVVADVDGFTPVSLLQYLITWIDLGSMEGDLGKLFADERCDVDGTIDTHRDHNDFSMIQANLDQFLWDAMAARNPDSPYAFANSKVAPRIIYDNLQVDGIYHQFAEQAAQQATPENVAEGE